MDFQCDFSRLSEKLSELKSLKHARSLWNLFDFAWFGGNSQWKTNRNNCMATTTVQKLA